MYEKIHYEQESNMSSSTSRITSVLIIIGLLLSFGAIYSVFSSGNYGVGIGLIIFFCLIGFPTFAMYKKQPNNFTEMRQTFIENGMKFNGRIIEVKEYNAAVPYNKHDFGVRDLYIKYFYVVQFVNEDNEEITVETDFLQVGKVDKDAVGKKCILYKHEGHHFVDEIER